MKTTLSRMRIVALLAAALFLAACSDPTAKAPPTGFITLSMKLDGQTLNNRSALQPQGIPNDPDTGDNALDSVRVTVRDNNDAVVRFRDEAGVHVASESGDDHFMLDATGSAEVSLPSHLEPYTFESRGLDENETVVAYHSVSQDISTTQTVQVQLRSVLGEAVLVPRLPTNIIAPGSLLDLMLVVMANGNETYPDDYLQVPLGDYSVTYDLDAATYVSLASESNRGIRLTIGDYCPDILVSGEVEGLREDGGTIQEASAPFTLINEPKCLEGAIEADTVNPEVTLIYDMSTRLATGTAADNTAIAKVEIYDGPVLVATTDLDAVSGEVAEIEFVNGTTGYRATLTADPVGGLEAFAYDAAGNQATSEEIAPPPTIDVEEGDSVQVALDSVASGGTVNLPAGTFSEPLTISGDVVIEGDPSGGTVLDLFGSLGPAGLSTLSLSSPSGSAGIEVSGADTTVRIKNVTLRGPGQTCSSRDPLYGIRVSGGATLYLENSAVLDIYPSATGLGGQCAVAIQVGRDADGTTGTAYLTGVTVEGFQKGGVVVDGAGSYLSIDGGSITGAGLTDATAQNGIQVSRGATAEIRGVTIEDVNYEKEGSADTAAGILLYEPGDDVLIEDTVIRNSGYALKRERQIAGGETVLNNNVFEDNTMHIRNSTPNELDASNNEFDGAYPSEASLEQLLALEDKIDHILDEHEPNDSWWLPQPEDYGLVSVVADNLYVTDSGSIHRAIDLATAEDTINVGGSHNVDTEIRLEKPLTLRGVGEDALLSVRSAKGIVIRDGGAGSRIENLRIELKGDDTRYAVELRKPDAQEVQLLGVTIVGHGQSLGGGTGVKVESGADASGFTMIGGSISDVQTGLYVAGTSGTIFNGVEISDVEFSGAADKAIYVEALSNAVFKNLTVTNSGNVGNSAGENGAGISIAITPGGTAENILISNTTIIDSGASPQGGGAALSIKSGSGATLDGVTILDSELSNMASSGSGVGLRVGSDTAPDAPQPTNVEVIGGTLAGSESAVVNHTSSSVTLTGVTIVGGQDGPLTINP